MTPGTTHERALRTRDIAAMFSTPNTNSRRLTDHSHRVAVVRETPRPAAALAF
jgi:hypothetical protein